MLWYKTNFDKMVVGKIPVSSTADGMSKLNFNYSQYDLKWPFLLLTSFVFLIYSNTFQSPWILDDFNNILLNPSVRLENLDGESLWKAIQASLDGGRLDRPLARLTFALNWYFGGRETWGYHLLNISIHSLCAFFLFLTVRALHRTPRGGSGRSNPYAVSLIAALIWAANPIQTQAVTYIVQRMAALAGLFYIVGLYCFIQGRLSGTTRRRYVWWCGCLVGFLLGVASKENAVLLPLAMALAELVFFQHDRPQRPTRRWLLVLAVSAVSVIGLTGVFFLTKGDTLSLFNYDSRNFTLWERLLTQPRVLLLYLSQLFYPVPFRLSIEHDILLSTSAFHPWSTLPSISAVVLLIALAIKNYRSWPYFSFGILFFFLNHLIESSIIPLELVFEHRNYIPSMFLFVPVANGLCAMLDYCRLHRRSIYPIFATFIVLLIFCLGTGTYVRNMAWESPEALWTDAARKAPSSGRALAYLAMVQSELPGGTQIALRLYEAALAGTKTNKQLEPEIFNNMAALYYDSGDFNQAARFWEKALKKNPDYADARFRLSLASLKAGRRDEALGQLQRLIAKYPGHIPSRNLRGMVYFDNNDFESALRDFKLVMKPGPEFAAGLINVGAVFVVTGHYDKADAFLASVPGDSEFMVPAFLWRLKSAVMRGDTSLASSCSERLLSSVSMNEVLEWLEMTHRSSIFNDKILLPPSDTRILKTVEKQAQIFFEFQRAQGKPPMADPGPAMFAGPAPSPTLP
jgi:tetratricopeptide (TPR) repeat protein